MRTLSRESSELFQRLNETDPLDLVTFSSQILRADKNAETRGAIDLQYLKDFKAKISAPDFQANKDEFLSIFDRLSKDLGDQIQDQEEKEAYSVRLNDLRLFADARWNSSEGENNQSRIALMSSVCNVCLRGLAFNKELLMAHFPAHKEDLNCFSGLSSRASSVTFSDKVSVNIVADAVNAVMLNSYNELQRFLCPDDAVHLMPELRRVFGLITQEEALAEDPLIAFAQQNIPAVKLLAEISSFPRRLHEELMARVKNLNTSLNIETLKRVVNQEVIKLADFEVEDKLDLGFSVFSQRAVTDVTEEFARQKKFEEVIGGIIKASFNLSEGDLLEIRNGELMLIDIFNFSSDGPDRNVISFNREGLLEVINGKKLAAAIKFQQEVSPQLDEAGIPFSRSGVSPPLVVKSVYGAKYLQTLVDNLKSPEIEKNIEAIDVIYALSRPGKGSAMLHIFKNEVFDEVKRLETRFKAGGDNLAKNNLFKIERYLDRADRAESYFAQNSKLASRILGGEKIGEGGVLVSEIGRRELLFFICNLSSEDSVKMVSQLSEAQLRDTAYLGDFGQGLSFYAAPDLVSSLVTRPDGGRILKGLAVNILVQNPIDEHAFAFLMLALDYSGHYGMDESRAAILENLSEIDLTRVKDLLRPIQSSIFKSLGLKNRILAGDALLRFIPLFDDDIKGEFLCIAASNGHLEAVRALIKAGVNINTPDQSGRTPLVAAVQCGQLAVLQELMKENKIQENEDLELSRSLLILAAEWGHLDIVKYLIREGAEINYQCQDGSTALMRASATGYTKVVKFLIEEGAKVDHEDLGGATPLVCAVEGGHIGVIRQLLAEGTDINHKAFTDGLSPLHLAVRGDRIGVINLLIQEGADLNCKMKNEGYTPLIFAASRGYLKPVKALIDAGADLNARAYQGQTTALNYAAHEGHAEVARALIAAGAEIDLETCNGCTPLMMAAQRGKIELVEILIDANASITRVDEAGHTALTLAAEKGHLEIVDILSTKKEVPKGATHNALESLPEAAKNIIFKKMLELGVPSSAPGSVISKKLAAAAADKCVIS
jgi:ankyrin repeat protein